MIARGLRTRTQAITEWPLIIALVSGDAMLLTDSSGAILTVSE